jgi:NifU-like protein involved in Fe-S cluster formation
MAKDYKMRQVLKICSANDQVVDIYYSQIGCAMVQEAAGIYVTIIAGVKTDQVSLAAALAALDA